MGLRTRNACACIGRYVPIHTYADKQTVADRDLLAVDTIVSISRTPPDRCQKSDQINASKTTPLVYPPPFPKNKTKHSHTHSMLPKSCCGGRFCLGEWCGRLRFWLVSVVCTACKRQGEGGIVFTCLFSGKPKHVIRECQL